VCIRSSQNRPRIQGEYGVDHMRCRLGGGLRVWTDRWVLEIFYGKSSNEIGGESNTWTNFTSAGFMRSSLRRLILEPRRVSYSDQIWWKKELSRDMDETFASPRWTSWSPVFAQTAKYFLTESWAALLLVEGDMRNVACGGLELAVLLLCCFEKLAINSNMNNVWLIDPGMTYNWSS
jgi:hypothetical protein